MPMAACSRSMRSVWSGQMHAISQRAASSSSTSTGERSSPIRSTIARQRGGELDAAPGLARQRDGRRTAQLAARDVQVVVAVEQQVEPGAGADVEVGERADLGGDDAERRQQQGAAPDLVRLRAAGDEQLGQLVGMGGGEGPERRHRIAVVGCRREVGIEAGETLVGSAGEQQVVHAREQQHRLALHRWGAQQQPGELGVGRDPGGQPVVQRRPRARRPGELGEQGAHLRSGHGPLQARTQRPGQRSVRVPTMTAAAEHVSQWVLAAPELRFQA